MAHGELTPYHLLTYTGVSNSTDTGPLIYWPTNTSASTTTTVTYQVSFHDEGFHRRVRDVHAYTHECGLLVTWYERYGAYEAWERCTKLVEIAGGPAIADFCARIHEEGIAVILANALEELAMECQL